MTSQIKSWQKHSRMHAYIHATIYLDPLQASHEPICNPASMLVDIRSGKLSQESNSQRKTDN